MPVPVVIQRNPRRQIIVRNGASRIGLRNALDGPVTITATNPTIALSINRNPRRRKEFASTNASAALSPLPSIQYDICCTRAARFSRLRFDIPRRTSTTELELSSCPTAVAGNSRQRVAACQHNLVHRLKFESRSTSIVFTSTYSGSSTGQERYFRRTKLSNFERFL
jgi:hypothetical protein